MLTFVVFVLTLFGCPISIRSCSSTYDIIQLISKNSNYRDDPCYKEWKRWNFGVGSPCYMTENEIIDLLQVNRMEFNPCYQLWHAEAVRWQKQEKNLRDRKRKLVPFSSESSRKYFDVVITMFGFVLGIGFCIFCLAACLSGVVSTIRSSQTDRRPRSPLATISNNDIFNSLVVSLPPPRHHSPPKVPVMAPRRDSLPTYYEALIIIASAPPEE